jgi:hypothetical protein
MEKIFVFDDGSIGSKLLQDELKERYDIKLIKVNPEDDLLTWFSPIDEEVKIHLHFCYEDYLKDHEKLRKEIQRLELGGYKNRIVLDYEGLDRKTMESRAADKFLDMKQHAEESLKEFWKDEPDWESLPNMKLVNQSAVLDNDEAQAFNEYVKKESTPEEKQELKKDLEFYREVTENKKTDNKTKRNKRKMWNL